MKIYEEGTRIKKREGTTKDDVSVRKGISNKCLPKYYTYKKYQVYN
jgi:hypothetical protein